MEMIMSTIFSTPPAAQGMAGQSEVSGLVAIVKRWWVAHLTRRIEQTAMAQLRSMSDRELKDIGLTRFQIEGAVTGWAGHRPFGRDC
jgi:uncharacterized protein YjiS (DUF1127 family)